MTDQAQAYEVAADTWLDGFGPHDAPGGQVAHRIVRGTHVMLGPHDDGLAARYGGWGNLRPATGHHGTNDGRGAAVSARPAPPRAMWVHGAADRVVALWEA
jgi:hypothetical protein